VCCLPDGRLLENNLNRDFNALLKRAGLPSIRFHDLRHTHATLLLALGTNAKVMSERLEHASITITLRTYSHVMPTMQREAAAKLDGILLLKPPQMGA
jgi:integrase